MKIKPMLQALLDGEDFSDHSTGREDGNGPFHDENCAFCDAWRAALWLLSPSAPTLTEFEMGDAVELLGGVRGRVMSTELLVRVEVQSPRGHGPYAYGMFGPNDLRPLPGLPEFTYWTNKADDVWEREESTQRVRLLRYDGQTMPLKAWERINRTFDDLLDVQVALVQIEKPW